MSLGPFPVDDATLLAVEHALGARLTVNDAGEHVVVGADYTLSKLLEFLSAYNPAQVVPLRDEDGYEIPNWVEYVGEPVYTRDCIIQALIAEVRRLRSVVSS